MISVHWIDWCIMIIPTLLIVGLALYTRRYVRGVADFLAAGRVAGRYVLSVGDLSSSLSVIMLVGLVEVKYQTGFAVDFWSYLLIPLSLIMGLSGFCTYRWRETKVLSFGQFLEMRYNRAFRIFASALRTLSEMIANALGPAIAAMFMVYFLGLPHSVTVFGFSLPCFVILLVILLVLAMVCIWPGGRVSLLITDTFQGLLSYPVFVIIVGYVIYTISWSGEVAPVMADRVAGENFLNPFDIEELRDFNIFALAVTTIAGVLNRASWFGNDVTNCGKTAHEQKMAGILGSWRYGFSLMMFTVLAIMIITIMNHRDFAVDAKAIRDTLSERVAVEVIADPGRRAEVIRQVHALPAVRHVIGVDAPLSRVKNLDTPLLAVVQKNLGNGGEASFEYQKFRTLYQQQMMTMTLKRKFPVGLIGMFGLLMIMLVLSTDDSRIFNASSTLVQDVIIPLRKTPLSTAAHLLWLRMASVGVALFFLVFGLLFVQVDYINMFLTIICALWLGGAGPVMLFGLYSRFGNSTGAFSAVFVGSGISLIGMTLQSYWAKYVYPFLEDRGWVEPIGAFLSTVTGPFNPIIVWEMTPEKFPINSIEIYFIAMVMGILAYIVGTLLTYRGPYNLDRLLHRGIYNIDGEKKNIKTRWTWRTFWDNIIGITPDYTFGDKVLAWSVFFYLFVYQVMISVVVVVIWNAVSPWDIDMWGRYFLITSLIVPAFAGIVTTVWFMWGGIRDTLRLFRDLKTRVDNPLDDGWVEGEVSLSDQAAFAERQKKTEHPD